MCTNIFHLLNYFQFSSCKSIHQAALKDTSAGEKIIVKKQPYQLLNTNHEFFPSFDASNFHELVDESS